MKDDRAGRNFDQPRQQIPATTYSVCTSTTPATALIAPAICGETLKRPGSFISTSVWRSSMMTSETSPSAPPGSAGAGFAGRPFAGPPDAAASGMLSRRAIESSGLVSRTKIRRPFWVFLKHQRSIGASRHRRTQPCLARSGAISSMSLTTSSCTPTNIPSRTARPTCSTAGFGCQSVWDMHVALYAFPPVRHPVAALRESQDRYLHRQANDLDQIRQRQIAPPSQQFCTDPKGSTLYLPSLGRTSGALRARW